MSLNKINYVDQETVITADNLNDIQDSIIALEDKIPSDIEEAGIITLTEYTEDDIQTLWDSVIV